MANIFIALEPKKLPAGEDKDAVNNHKTTSPHDTYALHGSLIASSAGAIRVGTGQPADLSARQQRGRPY